MTPGAAHASPLGQLLLERGLMSQEQLEDALLEQRVSGRRLGAILVENRIVTAHDLTACLQAQVREVIGEETAGREDVLESSHDEDERKRRLFRRKRRDGEAERPTNGVAPAPRAAKVQELLDLTEAQNDTLRQELARQQAELNVTQTELKLRDARIAELETRLEAILQERRQLASGLRAEIGELESDLRSLSTNGAHGAPARFVQPEAPGAVASGVTNTHLVLAPTDAGGHALREAPGVAPPVGGEVEIAGRRYVVVSHRRSPLGLDDRVCVHLRQR